MGTEGHLRWYALLKDTIPNIVSIDSLNLYNDLILIIMIIYII